jgi:hypothetical protein
MGMLLLAQVPQGIAYQTVVRDNAGNILANQKVSLRFSVRQGSSTGTVVYSDTYIDTTTNAFGLLNLVIGAGTTSDDFSAIDWSQAPYYLQVELDADGGSDNFVDMGTMPFMSVPYAQYAGNMAGVAGHTGEIQFNKTGKLASSELFLWNDTIGALGIGTQAPSYGRLVIQADSLTPDSVPLLEVKDKNGNSVFVIYNNSVHFYVESDTTGSRSYGAYKGGFVVSGKNSGAQANNDILVVNEDSTHIFIDKKIDARGAYKGGFIVSGKNSGRADSTENYFTISPSDSADVINPSKPLILWYPVKEAFLTGRVLIESPDSVGTNSMATGFESKAIGDFSQALGYRAIAHGKNSTAIGFKAHALASSSYAFGAGVSAVDTGAYAFGKNSIAKGKGSYVIGAYDTATATGAMAMGYSSKATGLLAFSLGAYAQANDTLSISMGHKTMANGVGAVALGDSTLSQGYSSMAMGYHTIARGDNATAMGTQTKALGNASIAMGHLSIARGLHAIAMGDSTVADNDDATSMGYHTLASGQFSTAMGHLTTAGGISSFAMGESTEATGYGAIAMGSFTKAMGDASMAIGSQTEAKGDASVAIGQGAVTGGDASVAYGVYTEAAAASSFVLGFYNEVFSSVNDTTPTSALFVIGNGLNDANRHNAVTVLKNGYVGIGTNTPDKLLTVNGDARVTGSIYYDPTGSTTYDKPDFVFKPNYTKKFGVLSVEKYIKRYGHLPWVTAAKDEKDGVNMTRMSFETLEAVENQQLQIIELKKENEHLKRQTEYLLRQNQEILRKLNKLEKKIK